MKELIEKIKTGYREEIKLAQRELEIVCQSIRKDAMKKSRPPAIRDFSVFIEEMKSFDKIMDDDHKAFFISALKWPFMAVGDRKFNMFSEFILLQIQNPSAKVRQAVTQLSDYFVISISGFTPLLEEDDPLTGRKINKEKAKMKRNRFGMFVDGIDKLIKKHYDKKFDKFQKFRKLPPSVYKSLWLLVFDHLFRSDYYEQVYAKYLIDNGRDPYDSTVFTRGANLGAEEGPVDFSDDDRFDDCSLCQYEKSRTESGKQSEIKGLLNAFENAKKQNGAFVAAREDLLDIFPKWMDCGWRREACGRDDCKICGRIKQARLRHIKRGEDPDSMESALEDAGQNFNETFTLVKKDAERMGVDVENLDDAKTQEPPEPKRFPLYNKVWRWRKSIMRIGDSAVESGSFWLATEPAEDLFWYANTLTSKTYRQLCNRWEIDNGDEVAEPDHKYTQYVLNEVLNILEKSLAELAYFNSAQKAELLLAIGKLGELKEKILNI